MATKKTNSKKPTTKKSTAKKSNNSRSMAAKGYVRAPKETKVEVVDAKKQEEVKESVKALVREEEVKEAKKEVKKTKKFDFKKYLTGRNIGIVAGAVVVLFVIILIIVNCNNQEKKLSKYMKQLGKVYYEEIYLPSFKDDATKEATLSKFTVTGINTDLENLVRAVSNRNGMPTDEEILAKFVNKKTDKKCNQSSTRIYFYPSEPYGTKDYKIEVKLDCGFNEK